MMNDPKNILIVLLLAAVILLGYTAMNPSQQKQQAVECKVPADLKVTYDKPLSDEALKGSYWACNGLVCNRYMTAQEWVNKNCFLQDNQAICRIRTQQGDFSYPLSAINLTAVRDCAEYLCLQEVLVRNASYMIKAP